MTGAELKVKETVELGALLSELREDLFRLRMQHHTGQLDNVSKLKSTRRDIARINTILKERETASQQTE
jgi:large subunit ribosomal protein L29